MLFVICPFTAAPLHSPAAPCYLTSTGLCALLVAVAVALFLSCGEKEYAFLEKEPLEVPPERSCVIWTVSGVLFGAVMTVMRLLNRKKYPPRGFSQKARRSVTSGPLFVFRQLLFTS